MLSSGPTREDAGNSAAAHTPAAHPAPVEHESPSAASAHPHRRGLWAVGLFKISKTLFFTAVGFGALKLIHADLGDLAARLIAWSHIDAEGRLAGFLLTHADLVTHHQLRRGALFAFLYAILCLVEGTGLLLEKRWAEFFTVLMTGLALPWEAYELTMHFAWYKVGLTAINVTVLLYLIWVLKRKGLLEPEPA